jgi:hypothetical protein
MSKTHYRKVFKSDHLGVADLEDLVEAKSSLIFTVKNVRQEIGVKVAGRKGDHNIAYFNESIKPLVLNAGNAKIMKGFAKGSSFVEDWGGIAIQLYIDPTVSFGGEITGGVRINPNAVQARKELQQNTTAWDSAVNAYKRDGNLAKVLDRIDVSEANQKLIAEQANAMA